MWCRSWLNQFLVRRDLIFRDCLLNIERYVQKSKLQPQTQRTCVLDQVSISNEAPPCRSCMVYGLAWRAYGVGCLFRLQVKIFVCEVCVRERERESVCVILCAFVWVSRCNECGASHEWHWWIGWLSEHTMSKHLQKWWCDLSVRNLRVQSARTPSWDCGLVKKNGVCCFVYY